MNETDHLSGNDRTHFEDNGGILPEDSEEEISLIDILLIVTRNRRLIMWTVVAFGGLGIMLALFLSREYTASARLIRELESETNMQGLNNLSFLRGFGVEIGGNAAGLTPDAYPDIIKSREVRMAVVKDTFYFPELEARTTFVDYVNRTSGLAGLIFDYTLGLPKTIRKKIRVEENPETLSAIHGVAIPTEEEERALEDISEMLTTGLDSETGLMTISVSTKHATLSAALTQSFVDHLVERVREIRTLKARKNLEFIQKQFDDAARALLDAENELARFEDRNNNIQRARLLTEQARLQRQVSFKSDLYSSLQAQLSQAQINLQRSEPVITLLEHPVPPLEPSGTSRGVMIIWLMVLGGLVGVGIAFVKTFIKQRSIREDERAKIEELQVALYSEKFLGRFFERQKTS